MESSRKYILSVLNKVHSKKISPRKACGFLKNFPYESLDFARLDHHRAFRRGFPEAVYCAGKRPEHVKKIVKAMFKQKGPIILTRADKKLYEFLLGDFPELKYNESAGMIYAFKSKIRNKKTVLILAAGTSDIPVAEEARQTLEIMGNRVKAVYDVGVAGIHRLLDKLPDISRANVIIVVAGMEGALGSVVGGLTDKPIIAVPTSVGYGSSFRGIAPLLTMMNSCSPGMTVVNIDNGFGAGYFASLINK